MSRQLLTFGWAGSPFIGTVTLAAQRLGWPSEAAETFDELVEFLVSGPRAVVAVAPNLAHPYGLGLLPLIEDLGTATPLLVKGADTGGPWPGDDACALLHIQLATANVSELADLLQGAVAGARSVSQKPYFRVCDYLRMGRALGETANLHFRFEQQEEAVIDIVEGEPRNVLFEDLEGPDALRAILSRLPLSTSVHHRKHPVEEHDVRLAPDSDDGVVAAEGFDAIDQSGTQPIHGAVLQALQETVTLAEAVEPALGTVSDEEFGRHFARAFEKTLARDYQTALILFEELERLRPNDGRVRFNLKRLRERL